MRLDNRRIRYEEYRKKRNRCIIAIGGIASAFLFIKSSVFRNGVALVSALVMLAFLVGGVVEIFIKIDNPFVAFLVSIGFLVFCIKGLCYNGK